MLTHVGRWMKEVIPIPCGEFVVGWGRRIQHVGLQFN
jgi:hypothetical protein